ncbi:MAG: AAA family ATPase [Verrucomicrobiales bacterium]|nr:AAA family ATPase [Verrucomicrobiales bacterium]
MPEELPPVVHIVAGPNGAGKTTFATEFLPHFAQCDDFVNADYLASGLSPFAPERAAFRAGRLMLERIRELARHRVTFGFETTLAGKTYVPILRNLRSGGYEVALYFLWLPNEEMALERVADRVAQGGHNVPEIALRRRFRAGLRNWWRLYRPLLDRWILFDNSEAEPKVIAVEEGSRLHVTNPGLFDMINASMER